MAPRCFPNTLPDLPTTSPAPANSAAAVAEREAAVSAVPRAALATNLLETLVAVRSYHSATPSIYTGSAGVAFALWQAYHSLRKHCAQHHQHTRPRSARPPSPSAHYLSSPPAGPHAHGMPRAPPSPSPGPLGSPPSPSAATPPMAAIAAGPEPTDLTTTLLAAALEHVREAISNVDRYAHGSRASALLDGAAGVHLTAAVVLNAAVTEAEAAGGVLPLALGRAAAAVAAVPEGEAFGMVGVGGGGGGGGGRMAADLAKERDEHVRAYVAAHKAALRNDNNEYLYGKAGYLQGAHLLNAQLGPGTVPQHVVDAVADELVACGRDLAGRLLWRRTDTPRPPLFYVWHDEPYMGAAHGLMGILFVMLHDARLVQQHGEDIRASLAYIASHEANAPGCSSAGGHYPTRASVAPPDPRVDDGEGRSPGKTLVHWCHGAPGAVFLWCKAYEVFRDPEYLALAQRAGEVVWQLGLLRKGHGLCHGISGNAYALLAVHRATALAVANGCAASGNGNGGGDPRWLHRARQFAAFTHSAEGRSVYDTPDRPLSLFEGRAGLLCLLADLIADDGGSAGARFPAFELPT